MGMLTVVLAVAVVGIALLAAAVVLDNTFVAFVAIALAVVGLSLLARDWLAERQRVDSQAELGSAPDGDAEHEYPSAAEPLEPDENEPDVPYDESESGAPDGDSDDRETA